MLTPAFELKQDDDFLIIEIKAPYSKISEAEIYFYEEEFKFYSKPYYLRLHLPGKVVENGREMAKYISDNGTYVVHMPKQSPGQVFTDLDLLTKLLAPSPRAASARPVIEVLENRSATDEEPPEVEEDWHVEQMPWTPQDEVSLLEGSVRKYGFDRQRTGVIARFKEEMSDLVDIADPERKSVQEARKERLKAEEGHFSAEHYLADRYEPAGVEQILGYEAPWWNLATCVDGSSDTTEDLFSFTEEEKTKMRTLPRKEYLLDKQLELSLHLGLVDILFAYAYNKRVTEGEDTVESGWNISKISATLSWFEEFWSLEQMVRSCFRRCLTYPLYRHWGLTYAVLRDVIQILQLGPRYVLRCLLEIHGIFSHHDSRYILNDLYITDYAVWIQSISPKRLQSLTNALKQVKVRKADLGLDIPELERGAKLAIAEAAVEEATASNSIRAAMQALCISNPLASTCEGTASSANNIIAEPESRHRDDDNDSTSSDNSSWSDGESDSSDSTSDSSSDSELDSDDDEIAAAGMSNRGDSVSVTSNSDSDSDDSDGSSSGAEGVDQCLLFVKDAEPEKHR
ncbi:protein SHQ1 homolog isoform X1 [Dermacentor variabilis]|uniref:protein SHQ1 homolog isoform X1 n=1 Tax=Dermacentor variabilis TaxID=34621 RepID=UPI003F5C3479